MAKFYTNMLNKTIKINIDYEKYRVKTMISTVNYSEERHENGLTSDI
jgi:uncharacterized protein YabE (DUF348 family)